MDHQSALGGGFKSVPEALYVALRVQRTPSSETRFSVPAARAAERSLRAREGQDPRRRVGVLHERQGVTADTVGVGLDGAV